MTQKDMNLQRDLWEQSGRVQYDEYRTWLAHEDYVKAQRVTNEQARKAAEDAATGFKLSPEKTSVQYEAFITGFLGAHAQRLIDVVAIDFLVDGKFYSKPLPVDLHIWYCYTSDSGHSIMCAIKSLYTPGGDDIENFLVPVSVKSVLRAGYSEQDGFIVVDLPYDSQVGLMTPEEEYEF